MWTCSKGQLDAAAESAVGRGGQARPRQQPCAPAGRLVTARLWQLSGAARNAGSDIAVVLRVAAALWLQRSTASGVASTLAPHRLAGSHWDAHRPPCWTFPAGSASHPSRWLSGSPQKRERQRAPSRRRRCECQPCCGSAGGEVGRTAGCVSGRPVASGLPMAPQR